MGRNKFIIAFLLCSFLFGLYTCDKVEVYNLETNVNPANGGTVEPASGGFDEGTVVELQANPSGNYLFSHWEGDITGSENPHSFEIQSDVNVTAVFELKEYSLVTQTEGEGTIREEVIAADSSTYEHGTRVQLTAEPAEGWRFVGWEGSITNSENPVTITVVENSSITAVFELREYPLHVGVEGEGSVSRDPDKLHYQHFEEVTLTAEPASDWAFDHWEGALGGSSNPETLTIDDTLSVTAVFDFIETAPSVRTRQVSDVTSFSANVGGEVTGSGGTNVTERGVCWDTSPSPDLSDLCTESGSGEGSFASSLRSLDPNTTYYTRAYATNSVGTGFGGELSFSTDNPSDPHSFLLSWQQNPSSTMTIDWHTDGSAEEWMQYRREGTSQWESVKGEVSDFPNSSREIHRVELEGLSADQVYEFRFTQRDTYLFRTMPRQNSRTIRFIAAGDVMHTETWMHQTAEVASGYDLDFVALGGDLAYANGGDRQAHRWHDYLETWSETMIRPDGRVIPHLVGIGNHEVQNQFVFNQNNYQQTDSYRSSVAPYFFALFPFPGQPGYNVLDFGNYMSLIFLDTNHTNPVDGQQTTWLEQTLSSRQDGRHLIPISHVGAYPSRRKDEVTNKDVREHWVPLFEEYGVRVAFENHNHNYKRTVPLLDAQQDASGITYMGDGSWGVSIEPPETYSYLQQAQEIRNFIIVEVDGSQIHMRAIDGSGNQFDQVTVSN